MEKVCDERHLARHGIIRGVHYLFWRVYFICHFWVSF